MKQSFEWTESEKVLLLTLSKRLRKAVEDLKAVHNINALKTALSLQKEGWPE